MYTIAAELVSDAERMSGERGDALARIAEEHARAFSAACRYDEQQTAQMIAAVRTIIRMREGV